MIRLKDLCREEFDKIPVFKSKGNLRNFLGEFTYNPNLHPDDEEYTKIEFFLTPHDGWIEAISVMPNLRGKGIGRNLATAVESIFTRLKIKEIKVKNVYNPEFWEYLGYKKISSELYKKQLP